MLLGSVSQPHRADSAKCSLAAAPTTRLGLQSGVLSRSNRKRGGHWVRVPCMNYFGAQGTDPPDPEGAGHAFGPPWAWS